MRLLFLPLVLLPFFAVLTLAFEVLPNIVPPFRGMVTQEQVKDQPYQYFVSDGVGGNAASCWLSPNPYPPTEGITCRFAEPISQMKGRQIWQCEGDKDKFCEGCRELEKLLTDPKDLVNWKIQC